MLPIAHHKSNSLFEGSLLWIAISASAFAFLKFQRRESELEITTEKKVVKSSSKSLIKKIEIPRTESEFSIGLGRNDSVEKHLMELGTLCDDGQIILNISKRIILSCAVCIVTYYSCKHLKSS